MHTPGGRGRPCRAAVRFRARGPRSRRCCRWWRTTRCPISARPSSAAWLKSKRVAVVGEAAEIHQVERVAAGPACSRRATSRLIVPPAHEGAGHVDLVVSRRGWRSRTPACRCWSGCRDVQRAGAVARVDVPALRMSLAIVPAPWSVAPWRCSGRSRSPACGRRSRSSRCRR